jgi:hypothetical protein
VHDSDTEPAYPLARTRPSPAAAKRPWWLTALVSGFGMGAGAVLALGLGGAFSSHGDARGSERGAEVRTSAVVQTLPPGSISLDERLRNIETTLASQSTTLTSVVTELRDVKSRLPPKRP